MDSSIVSTEVRNEDSRKSPLLPSINERLGHLRPSRELLEYYRKKIAEYDEEHDSMVSKLEEYKMTYEEQHKFQWETRQREEEIVELQKALSDMQVYLFQEREHVLRLYAENDRLKIRELEDKKKIQQLLALGGTVDSEVSYFLKEPPAKAIIDQKHSSSSQRAAKTDNRQSRAKKKQLPLADRRRSLSPNPEEKYQHDNEVLSLQVEALQSQLQEQTKLAKEQMDALLEDRRVKDEEMETRRQRDETKIATLTEKLHKTQDLLYESTKDFLELRYQGRSNERQWMAEKDHLLRELDTCKQQLNMSKESILDLSDATLGNKASQIEETKSLDYQLQQSQKLCEMYREQVIQLEDELSRIREEGDVTREVFKTSLTEFTDSRAGRQKEDPTVVSSGGTVDSEVSYFLKEPPAKAIIDQKHSSSSQRAAKTDNRQSRAKKKQLPLADRRRSLSPNPEEKYQHDNEVLSLQVEALQSQLQEQTKLAKEQMDALLEDRRVKDEEMETRRQRDETKIATLTEKLHKTQDLLYESTKDFLELRYQGRIPDYQLQQSQKLCEMYREQVIQLEDELSRIREEGDVTREVFKDRSGKMAKRLNLMNQRYQDLERRRNLEVEGFQTDIKNLRSRLKDVERQLYKVTLGFSTDMDVKRPEDLDMQILRNVRATAGRSKKVVEELKNLKSKIYGIENDLKHL
ncbi:hypothetical protein ScPMuIL_008260 [Solemya velum]